MISKRCPRLRGLLPLTLALLAMLAASSFAEAPRRQVVRAGPHRQGPSLVPEGPRIPEAEAIAALRAQIDSLSSAGAFSGAVLVARGDAVLLRKAWGLASRSEKRPNTPETRFNLGSINKAFTRLAIEQLAAEGKLRLDDKIDRWLPDYPADKARKITIEQLLEHRAGTGDIFTERFRQDPSRLRTLGDWMDLIRDEPLQFEPGTRQEYSNAGYVLLGAIVEKASGLSYYDYVRRRIFEPAGMRSTDSYARDEKVQNRAVGYTRRLGGEWRENTSLLPGRGGPAGGGYSTLDDLKRFADAMRSGRLGVQGGEGLGIAGGAPGINAALESFGGYVIVVLANVDPPAAEEVAGAARGWLRRAGVRPPKGAEEEVGGGPGPMGPGVERSWLPPGGARVEMTRAGHLPALRVRVNGRGPYLFALDTGAGGAARIDGAVAAELGLARIGVVRSGDPSGRNTRILPLVRIDSLEIGGARFYGVRAAARDSGERLGPKVDGVLGFALFEQVLLTLDYPAREITLEAGELPAADGAEVLDCPVVHGIPRVALEVAGVEVEADVDAGAPGGFSLPASMASRLSLASEPRVVGRARTAGNEFEVKAAPLAGAIRLGRYRFENPVVELQPVFPMVNLGSRVLGQFRITFDQRTHRMRLTKPV